MDSKVTLDLKSIVLAGLVLVALVLAYLVGTADDDPVTRAVAAEDSQEAPHSVSMSGVGKVTVVPDQLAFTVSVTVKRTDVETAFDDSSRIRSRVLAALKEYGVERGDVQTTGLSIDPDYQYFSYQPPQITGYRVTQRDRVTITDLKQAGKAISAAVHAGGDSIRVGSIALQVGDREGALQQARKDAVAQAKEKAELYADETGQSLGDVLSLREVHATPLHYPSPYRTAGMSGALYDMASAVKAIPIRAGEQDLKVTVRVVWEFA